MTFTSTSIFEPGDPDERPRTAAALPAWRRPARARRRRWRWRPASAGSAWPCRSRWTTSTCGCCATRSTAAPAGPWWTAASAGDESKAQWEQVFATQLEGLPVLRVIVTHMHPDHIGLAHWLCERWNAPLWISATDYNAARLASQSTTGFGGEHAARLLCLARPDRPGVAGEDPRAAPTTTRAWCPRCPRSFRRMHGRRRGSHRRARLALHQRLRPCARAHRAVLRGAEAC